MSSPNPFVLSAPAFRGAAAAAGAGVAVSRLPLVLFLAGILVSSGAVRAGQAAAGEASKGVRFNRDVRPILSDRCFACHGPDEDDRGGDLRLDRRDDAIADRGGYAAIVPGKPEASEILRRIESHDPDEVMPPPRAKKPKITAEQMAVLRQWIADGAAYQNHWAFEPLERCEPPVVTGSTWGRNPIDAFIESRLREEGLAPSPEAPKDVLLRRVALDLVGLQPTPEEQATFLADPAPDAYDRAVDRLLASPHYGERWGRHWLDQARYADSNGYSIDADRAMWPYRDWVIDALNRDLPFDRFTIEQIAGDLLPKPTKSQLVATGFHRNTMINQEGGTKPEQFRVEAAVDRVNTTGAVWLGLTVGCAQCHSHKYDPLTHKEYFQLFGFFNSDADVNDVADTVEVVQGEIAGTPGEVTRAELDAADRLLSETKIAARGRLRDWLAVWPSIESDASVLANAWSAPAIAVGKKLDGVKAEADGVTLEIAGDKDRRIVTVPLAAASTPITAIRLVVPAAADPDGGPPRHAHAKDDLFVVSEVAVTAAGKAVPLMTAFASGERAKFAASLAVDGKPKTGWSAAPAPRETERPEAADRKSAEIALVLVPREPIAAQAPLSLRIDFAAGGHQVPRRLRIETTSDAALAPVDPASVEILADAIRTSRGADDGPNERDVLKVFANVDLVQQAVAFDREALRRRAAVGRTMVMRRLPKPRETFVHLRGDYLNPDTKTGPLAAGTPAFLPAIRGAAGGSSSAGEPTRLDLARWLVRADNPLTPRVTVNRVWMRYFGTGLVETENDFGTQGSAPTHPELLDWLAGEFVRSGWSLKKLHRLIVTSAAYRQASVHRDDLAAKDPRNLLLGRQNRVRLDAEVVRDTALVAAGLLCADIGGPSVYPPQPEGVYVFTQAGKQWPTSTGPQRHRRSLYTQFYRSAPHPLFTTFDAPNFSTVCTRRLPSNTPLQSLMLANDPIFVEAATAIGDRVAAATPAAADPAAGIDLLFRLCLSRPPTATEERAAREFLARQRAEAATDPVGPWRVLARGVVNTDNFVSRE